MMNTHSRSHRHRHTLTWIAAASLGLLSSLAGCGGGGGDSGATPQSVKAADAHCSSLQSGPHRGIALSASNPNEPNSEYALTLVENVDLSGPTPVVAGASGRATLTPVAGEACHYTSDGADVLVSSSGVVAFTRPNPSLPGAALQLFLAFPEQSGRPVSELAGTWVGVRSQATRIDYADTAVEVVAQPADSALRVTAAASGSGASTVIGVSYDSTALTVNIATDGTITMADCLNGPLTAPLAAKTTCADVNATLGQLSRHADGAWTLTDAAQPGQQSTWRAFAYQTSKGKMLVVLNALGEMMFFTPKVALPLPPLGYSTHTADAVMLGSLGTPIEGILDSRYTVTQRLSATAYTRTGTINGSAQTQTLTLNAPLEGLAWRQASAGLVVALPLQGLGMTFASLPQSDGSTKFALSIDRSN